MRHEILMLIIGSVIGVVASVGTMFAERALNRAGKLLIFYKRIYSKSSSGRSWGKYKENDGCIIFEIPMFIEFQNTTYSPRVIRDFAIYAYKDNTQSAKFTQIEFVEITHRSGNQITGKDTAYYGESNGAYSFMVGPISISHYTCEFMLKSRGQQPEFNNLRIGYYDEHNKFILHKICDIENGWQPTQYKTDKDWVMLD